MTSSYHHVAEVVGLMQENPKRPYFDEPKRLRWLLCKKVGGRPTPGPLVTGPHGEDLVRWQFVGIRGGESRHGLIGDGLFISPKQSYHVSGIQLVEAERLGSARRRRLSRVAKGVA